MISLAVLILTKNEEENIVSVIRNARQCGGDVMIIDSGSTDRTVELAEQEGATVAFRAWNNDYAAQRNFAKEQTQADWVLYLDADERLTPELVEEIRQIIAADTKKQYSIQRKSAAFGVKFNYGVLHPDWVPRLFPRECVTWTGMVHERPECKLPVEKLKGHIEHYTYKNWRQWEVKMSLYSTIWSHDAYKRGKRTSLAGALAHATGGFFKMCFLKRGILDGWMGFYLSYFYFFYTSLKYLKLYELQKQNKKQEGYI